MADLDVAAVVAAARGWPDVEAGAATGAATGATTCAAPRAATGATTCAAPGATTCAAPGAAPSTRCPDTVVLSTGGRTFALVSRGGVELTLPPRVRDMLVETGRAAALPSPAHALVTPDDGGQIDLDLLRLAYERARVTTAYRTPAYRPGEPPR